VAGLEADPSPTSSALVKNEWSLTSSPLIRLRGVCWNDFTGFTFTFLHSLVTVCDTQPFNKKEGLGAAILVDGRSEAA